MLNYERIEIISYNKSLNIATYKVAKNDSISIESHPLTLTASAVKLLQEKGVKIIK